MKRIIFAIVAPSGSGKSTIINSVVSAMPDQVAIIKSVTTRARRDASDDLHYEFISREEFVRARKAGELIQSVEYAGNGYGVRDQHVKEILSQRHGILALVEQSIPQYRKAGYTVVPIRIRPIGAPDFPDAVRQKADRQRAKIKLDGYTVENHFAPGGLERAVKEVIAIVQEQTQSVKSVTASTTRA